LIKGETFWLNGGSDVKLVFPPIIIIIKGSLCWLITPARPTWKRSRQEQVQSIIPVVIYSNIPRSGGIRITKSINLLIFIFFIHCTCTVIVQWVLAWIRISFVDEFENREICKRIRQQTSSSRMQWRRSVSVVCTVLKLSLLFTVPFPEMTMFISAHSRN
jgi:hypothetical protein